ncbi:MAG: hypothetical protein MHMPM18_004986 [Marteilia pararefringens]
MTFIPPKSSSFWHANLSLSSTKQSNLAFNIVYSSMIIVSIWLNLDARVEIVLMSLISGKCSPLKCNRE